MNTPLYKQLSDEDKKRLEMIGVDEKQWNIAAVMIYKDVGDAALLRMIFVMCQAYGMDIVDEPFSYMPVGKGEMKIFKGPQFYRLLASKSQTLQALRFVYGDVVPREYGNPENPMVLRVTEWAECHVRKVSVQKEDNNWLCGPRLFWDDRVRLYTTKFGPHQGHKVPMSLWGSDPNRSLQRNAEKAAMQQFFPEEGEGTLERLMALMDKGALTADEIQSVEKSGQDSLGYSSTPEQEGETGEVPAETPPAQTEAAPPPPKAAPPPKKLTKPRAAKKAAPPPTEPVDDDIPWPDDSQTPPPAAHTAPPAPHNEPPPPEQPPHEGDQGKQGDFGEI